MTDAIGHAAPVAPARGNQGAGPDTHAAHHAHDAQAGEEPLGPIDVPAWIAGILGVAIGLVMAACFVLATAGQGAF